MGTSKPATHKITPIKLLIDTNLTHKDGQEKKYSAKSQKKIQELFCDYRNKTTEDNEDLEIEYEVLTTATGYQMEIILPWKNLNFKPQVNKTQLLLEVYINDSDSKDKNDRQRYRWFPYGETSRSANFMQTLMLADKADLPIKAIGLGRYKKSGPPVIKVMALQEFAGQECEVLHEGKAISKGIFKTLKNQTVAELKINMNNDKSIKGQMEIFCKGKRIGYLYLDLITINIQKYIALLGHKKFKQRNEAEKQLRRIGPSALPFLNAILQENNPDPEIFKRASRLKKILDNL